MGAEQPTSGRTTNVPPAQYLDARHAIEAIAMSSGRRMLDAPFTHVCVMAAYAGALIALGALFSVLLSAGVDTQGPRRLLEGLGFSAGFFFVIQSQAALFTEINVVMPVTLLHYSKGSPGESGTILGIGVCRQSGWRAGNWLSRADSAVLPARNGFAAGGNCLDQNGVSRNRRYQWMDSGRPIRDARKLARGFSSLLRHNGTYDHRQVRPRVPRCVAVRRCGISAQPGKHGVFFACCRGWNGTRMGGGNGLEHPPCCPRKSPRGISARHHAVMDFLRLKAQRHDRRRSIRLWPLIYRWTSIVRCERSENLANLSR